MSLDAYLPNLLSSSSTIASFLGNYAVHSTALLGVAWACTGRHSPLPVGTRESVWRGALVLGIATAAAATAFPALGVVPRALADRLPRMHWPQANTVNMTFKTDRPTGSIPMRVAQSSPVLVGATAPALPSTLVDYSRFATSPKQEILVGPVPAVTPSPSTTTEPVPVMQNSMTTAAPPMPWGVWVSGAWLALAAAGLARLAWLRIRLSRSLGPREPVGSTRLACLFDSLADEMGLTGQVRLTQSRRLSTPVALPTGEVCVPSGILEALPAEQQRCILAHELAHVARRDPAWLMGLRAIEAAFWFQPLNRVARRKLQVLAEYACDDAAANSTTGGDLAMASSLATAARWLGGDAPVLAAAMAAGPSTLVRRVERLLGDAEPKHLTGRGRLLLAVPALAALSVVTLSPSALADGGKSAPPAPPGAPTTPEPAVPAPPAPSVRHVIVGAGSAGEAPVAYTFQGGSAQPVPLTPLAEAEGLYSATVRGGAPFAIAGFPGGSGAYAFSTEGKRNVIGVGISPVQGALAAQLGLEPGTATVIDQVYDDSEASKAGLKQYDIITGVEGEDASPEAIRKAIAAKKPGEPVTLEVRRGTETLTIPVPVREVEGGLFATTPAAPGSFYFTPGPDMRLFGGGEELSKEILEEIRKSFGPDFDLKMEQDLKNALGSDFQEKIDAAVKRALEASRAGGRPAPGAFGFGTTEEARADAMRRAELAMERARQAFPSSAPGRAAGAREEMARALERLAQDQARLQEELARMHAGALSAHEDLVASTGGAASRLRTGYADLIAKDLVKKLSAKGYTGDLAELEESVRASARAALAASNEVSESISCTNDKCKGTLSVDSKSYAEALLEELLENHGEVVDSVKGGEDVLRSAVKSVCGDNESYRLTWEN